MLSRCTEYLKDARRLRHIHAWLTLQWAVHLPVVVIMYFAFPQAWGKVSILYLSLVSIYANMVTHWGAWGASRAEETAAKTGV